MNRYCDVVSGSDDGGPPPHGNPFSHTSVHERFMMRRGARFLLLCLIGGHLVLQGCAESYSSALRHYQKAESCCASMSEFTADPIRVGERIKFGLGTDSPLYGFESGRSYFRVFALPDGPYPFRATFSSYLVGDYLQSAHIFYPQVVTVDEKFRVIRSTGAGSFRVAPMDFLESVWSDGNFRHKLDGELLFTGENRDERYLLVMTTDQLLRMKTAFPLPKVPMLVFGSTGKTPPGKDVVSVPHAPAGLLEVVLTPLQTGHGPSPTAIRESVPARTGSASMSPDVGPAQQPAIGMEGTGPETVRSEQVAVKLKNGQVIGRLELGRTSIDEARRLYAERGAGLGSEQQSRARFPVRGVSVSPAFSFTPPGTSHSLYFDGQGRLVLFVDGEGADSLSSAGDFKSRFPGFRETGRLVGSYELQADLSSCVTLIAVFRTVDDSVDSTAFAYICPVR